MRRWVRLVATVAVSLALVAGCSDDDESGATPTTDPAEVAEETEIDPPPPLPDEDLSVDIEGGTILFHGFDERARGLFATPPDADEPTEIDVGDFAGVMAPAVAPDGVTVAVLGWPEGRHEDATTLLVGTVDGGFEHLLVEEDLSLWCARWFPDGERLLVTAFVEEDLTPRLFEVDLGGEVTEHSVDPGRYDCAIPLDDDRVVLSYLGMDTSILGLAEADLVTGESEVLFEKLGCQVHGGELSPDGRQLVTGAVCDMPGDSGIHLVDLESGDVDHVLTAEVAYPAFSPSGEWIVFALYSSPEAMTSTIWAIRTDGSGFREITDHAGIGADWVATAGAESR